MGLCAKNTSQETGLSWCICGLQRNSGAALNTLTVHCSLFTYTHEHTYARPHARTYTDTDTDTDTQAQAQTQIHTQGEGEGAGVCVWGGGGGVTRRQLGRKLYGAGKILTPPQKKRTTGL